MPTSAAIFVWAEAKWRAGVKMLVSQLNPHGGSRMLDVGVPIIKMAKIGGWSPATIVRMAACYGYFSPFEDLRGAGATTRPVPMLVYPNSQEGCHGARSAERLWPEQPSCVPDVTFASQRLFGRGADRGPRRAPLAGVFVEPPFVFGSRNKRWLVPPNIHNYDVCWGPRLDFARHDSLIFRERLGISYGTVRMRFQKVS